MHVDKYPPIVAQLLTPARIAPLDAGTPNQAVRARLDDLSPSDVVGTKKPADADMARACLAGLWLYHDFLDESHRISQEIETTTGSFWHGIMHRREGDFSNAKYWFRRVDAAHPVLARLATAVAADPALVGPTAPRGLGEVVAGGAWDPFRFVDLCQSALRGRGNGADACTRAQHCEWRLLFDFCFDAAVGQRT